jgi:hypothetical protein
LCRNAQSAQPIYWNADKVHQASFLPEPPCSTRGQAAYPAPCSLPRSRSNGSGTRIMCVLYRILSVAVVIGQLRTVQRRGFNPCSTNQEARLSRPSPSGKMDRRVGRSKLGVFDESLVGERAGWAPAIRTIVRNILRPLNQRRNDAEHGSLEGNGF